MRQLIVMMLGLTACAELGSAFAADRADELALLAGHWQAEASLRTGQQPAEKKILEALTLEIKGDRWNQKFRGDTAPYAITLETSFTPKMIVLTHLKVEAIRRCTYDLEGDLLTVTEELGDSGDIRTMVWKRKPAAGDQVK